MSHRQFEHPGSSTEINSAAGKTADLDHKLANQALDIMLNASRQVVAQESSAGGAIAGSIIGGAIASGAGATARRSAIEGASATGKAAIEGASAAGKAAIEGASAAGKAAIEGASAAGKAAIEGASAAGRSHSSGYEAGVIVGRTIADTIANGIGSGSGLSDIPTMPRKRANTPSENSSNLPPVIIKDGVINIGPRNSEFLNNKEGSGKQHLPNKLPRSLSEILRDSLIYPRTYEP